MNGATAARVNAFTLISSDRRSGLKMVKLEKECGLIIMGLSGLMWGLFEELNGVGSEKDGVKERLRPCAVKEVHN